MTADLSTASAAPGDLEFVRRFVNTLDIEGGTDELGTPSQAAAWLDDRGPTSASTEPGSSSSSRSVRRSEIS